MKLELVQTSNPAVNGEYDVTGATPASDMVGALFFGSTAITTDLNSGNVRYSFGATDLTNNLCLSMGGANNTTTANITSQLSTTLCLETATGGGGVTGPTLAYLKTLSNGVGLTMTNYPGAARLLDTLLISGTDSAMKCGAVQFATADTTKTITHGLGGTPDVIMLLCSMGQNGTDTSGTGISIGFWERAGTGMCCSAYCATNNASPTNQTAYISNTKAGAILHQNGKDADITVGTVGSTTFAITLSSAADATPKMIGWIALRGLAAQMYSGVAVATLPTSTGNTALISGISGKPQCYIALPTRMTSVNTVVNSDAAGSFGASIACTPDFVTTYQGSSSQTFESGLTTSVARHQISIDRGMVELLNTGATDAIGTLHSWDATGATVNYTAAASGAYLAPVLAFGLASGTASVLTANTFTYAYTPQSVTFSTNASGNYILPATAMSYAYVLAPSTSDVEMDPSAIPYLYSLSAVTFTLGTSAYTMSASTFSYTRSMQAVLMNNPPNNPSMALSSITYSINPQNVAFTYFIPTPPGTFPNVVGLTLQEAEVVLQQAGALDPVSLGYFGNWPISVVWQSVPEPAGTLMQPGYVTAQNPAPATPVVTNAPITLTVVEQPTSVSYPGTNPTINNPVP